MNNKYFGKVEKRWAGFSAEFKFRIPYFDQEVEIFLDEEFDEEYKKITTPPTDAQVDEYEQTLKAFLDNIDEVILEIQQSAFEYYKERYARYYEQPFEDIFDLYKGTETENDETHPPLCLDTKEKHFEYMKDILSYIRILDNRTIRISIHYLLDTEHGLE
ncbi:MAG: hypothetical protein LBV69_00410, partial [Bacteroidales bacterium]|nr:hypothetical protein [Bacteroidales bacterium]